MTLSDNSAIMWFIWSIGVCVFAFLIATNMGAFSMISAHSIDNSTSPVVEQHTQDEIITNSTSTVVEQHTQDEIIELIDGSIITITATQRKQYACNFRFGLWC